ncbi:DUF1488 family protein [Noviherbaspirillum humi]|nr:DUF1488 family protein [Noviherbaspirillum humi]
MRVATAPKATEEGVLFTVEVGFRERECLVSRNALTRLRRTGSSEEDLLDTYRAFEDRIQSVARRMVVAGASGSPLVLFASSFN